MRGILSVVVGWWRLLWRRGPEERYGLLYVEGDELPDELPNMTLVVAREGGTSWIAGMTCPCGCGRRLEMMLLPEVRPRWQVVEHRRGPSLYPSVWASGGCRSHFWLRRGEVHRCGD